MLTCILYKRKQILEHSYQERYKTCNFHRYQMGNKNYSKFKNNKNGFQQFFVHKHTGGRFSLHRGIPSDAQTIKLLTFHEVKKQGSFFPVFRPISTHLTPLQKGFLQQQLSKQIHKIYCSLLCFDCPQDMFKHLQDVKIENSVLKSIFGEDQSCKSKQRKMSKMSSSLPVTARDLLPLEVKLNYGTTKFPVLSFLQTFQIQSICTQSVYMQLFHTHTAKVCFHVNYV